MKKPNGFRKLWLRGSWLVPMVLLGACDRPSVPYDPDVLPSRVVMLTLHRVGNTEALIVNDTPQFTFVLDATGKLQNQNWQQVFSLTNAEDRPVPFVASSTEQLSSEDGQVHTQVTIKTSALMADGPTEAVLKVTVPPISSADRSKHTLTTNFTVVLLKSDQQLQESQTVLQSKGSVEELHTTLFNPSNGDMKALVVQGRCTEGLNVATFYAALPGLAARESLDVTLAFRNGAHLTPAATCDLWGTRNAITTAIVKATK